MQQQNTHLLKLTWNIHQGRTHLGHKTHHKNLKEWKPYKTCSYHTGINLEISNRKIIGKLPNKWRFNNTLLNNKWAQKRNKGKLKIILN